jgi:hydrogenase nickel incorporation protein HypA/HybF
MFLASSRGIKKASRIRVKIGEFHLVNPDQIRHSFEAVSRGTPAEGAELVVEISPLKFSDVGGGRETRIVSGQELLVEEIE